MSQARKNQIIDQAMKIGNLKRDYSDWLTLVFRLAADKFRDLKPEDFVEIHDRYGDKPYFEEIFKLFDESFSEEEIEQILNFWSTPAGRKLVHGSFSQKQKDFHTQWARGIESACMKIRQSRQEGNNADDQT